PRGVPQGGGSLPARRRRRPHRPVEPLGHGAHAARAGPLRARGTRRAPRRRLARPGRLAPAHPPTRRPGPAGAPRRGLRRGPDRRRPPGRRRPRLRPRGAPQGLAAGVRCRTLAHPAARRPRHPRPRVRPGLRGADGRSGPAGGPARPGGTPGPDRSSGVSAGDDGPARQVAEDALRWVAAHRAHFLLGDDALAADGRVDRSWKPLSELAQVCATVSRHTAPGDPLHAHAVTLLDFAWEQTGQGELFLRLQRLEPFATYPLEVSAALAAAGFRHPRFEADTAVVGRARGWRLTEQEPTRRLGVLHAEERAG